MYAKIEDKKIIEILDHSSSLYNIITSDVLCMEQYTDIPITQEQFEDIKAGRLYDYIEGKVKPHDYTNQEIDEIKRSYNVSQIIELQQYLISTDWTVVKCSEIGCNHVEQYPEVHKKRLEAREKINELQLINIELCG